MQLLVGLICTLLNSQLIKTFQSQSFYVSVFLKFNPQKSCIVHQEQELKEKNSGDSILINQGKVCPYCFNATEYVDSNTVYSKSYGMIYLCRPCDAWVGVHQGTTNAKGRLADGDLRYWKIQAHSAFDPIWQQDLNKGESKHIIRNRAYDWLSAQLQIPRSETHIGFFDIILCQRTVAVCKEYPVKTNSVNVVKHTEPSENKIFGKSGYPGAYAVFEDNWYATFQKKFGEHFWFDDKKFCYSLELTQDTSNTQIVDYYPKADKILIRKENRWIKPGLSWLIANVL
jgi:hypothetical protein